MRAMTVGERIRTIRNSVGGTQEVFAKKVGTSRASLGSYEEGRAMPNYGLLLK